MQNNKPFLKTLITARPMSLALAVVLTLVLPLTATSTRSEETLQPASHGESSHEPHHVLGVFLGDTTEDRREGVTIGIEYEYRVSERVGIGATFEHISGDFDTNVYVLPIALHSGPWKVYAGPGFEKSDRGDEQLFRVGAEYGFHLGRYEISPQIDVDFVDGEKLFVIGVVFARPF
ncbi:MAG: hypothetical protein AB8B57_16325 [Congregibacter sp.]